MINVVVIGVSGRPLSLTVVEHLFQSSFKLDGVVIKKRFAKRGNLIDIFTQTIRKQGLKFIVQRLKEAIKKPSSLSNYCKKNKIDYLICEDVNGKEVEKFLLRKQPKVIVLAGPPIIKDHIINKAKLYTINTHRSLLPKYAGLDAIFWALYHEEKEIGLTIHTVNQGIDTGDIIIQKSKIVEINDTLESLTNWYYQNSPLMILEALKKIQKGDYVFRKQNIQERSYFSWPSKEQRQELNKRLLKIKE